MPEPHRLVVVGASNLARMALVLLDAQRAAAARPVEMHAASGRGRSYGMPSRLLGRGIGSILDSGIWQHLASEAPRPTTAMLMDVGNDLLYGAPVPRMLEWAATALQRLAAGSARRVVIGLPIDAIRKLSVARYLFVRSVLFPASRLSLPQAIDGAMLLHEGLAALAPRHGATFHALPVDWYGLDPVHVRRACWDDAARTWLQAPTADTGPRVDSTIERLRLLFLAPAERRWFGHRRCHVQPARHWPDGSSLSLW